MSLFTNLINRWRADHAMQSAIQREWRGDVEGAIKELKVLIEGPKPTADRLKALALVLVKNGRSEEACVYSEKALALAPNNPEVIVVHARILRRMQRYEEALPLITVQYHKNKKNIFVAMELCKLFVDMGRSEEAMQVFEETDRWFAPMSKKESVKRNGMLQAYSEGKAKLRQGAKR